MYCIDATKTFKKQRGHSHITTDESSAFILIMSNSLTAMEFNTQEVEKETQSISQGMN